MVPHRNGSLPDRRHDGFSRAVFGAWHCLLVVLAVVSVIGEGEVEDLSVGRRGNASIIRRGSAGLFPLSSKGGFRVFQGNLEEEGVSWERIPRFPWTTRTSRGWEPLIARPTTRLQSRWIACSERAAHQMGVGLENTGPRLPHTGLHLLTPTFFSYSFRKVTRGSMKKTCTSCKAGYALVPTYAKSRAAGCWPYESRVPVTLHRSDRTWK